MQANGQPLDLVLFTSFGSERHTRSCEREAEAGEGEERAADDHCYRASGGLSCYAGGASHQLDWASQVMVAGSADVMDSLTGSLRGSVPGVPAVQVMDDAGGELGPSGPPRSRLQAVRRSGFRSVISSAS